MLVSSPTSPYILEMLDISKSFNGVKVLDQASLRVRAGEVQVLLGENGAGKSTLIKILAGAYRREAGEVVVDGQRLPPGAGPRDSLAAGVSVIYQEFNLVPHLSISENIFLGKEFGGRFFVNPAQAASEAKRYLDLIGLAVPVETRVERLGVAEKQLVEIAKAISNRARVLVLDEPTAALTDRETNLLFDLVRDLKRQGLGIVYISHRLKELFSIGDRCTVMRDGCTVGEVAMAEVDEQELTRLMVGRQLERHKRVSSRRQGEKALEVQGLYYHDRLRDINLTLDKGEILGLAGLVGAGRSELARCIVGDYRITAGEVSYQGKVLRGGVAERIDRGVVYLSEDRKDAGLILSQNLADNIALPSLREFARPLINQRRLFATCQSFIDRLRIRPPNLRLPAKNLSGGNQQKVVIAKWLCSRAGLYLFDEPTRGIDVGAREEIYTIMRELVAAGASIIMISSDLAEILRMCDRVAVMAGGRITAQLLNDGDLTQEKIMTHALAGVSEGVVSGGSHV